MEGKKRQIQHSPTEISDYSLNSTTIKQTQKKPKKNSPFNLTPSKQTSEIESNCCEMDLNITEATFKNLQQNTNPNISDVMKGISLMLMKMDAMHITMLESNKRLDQQEREIIDIKSNVSHNSTNINHLREQINIINQQQIDSEVILIGFQDKLSKSDEAKIISNISNLYNINTKSILNYYSYVTKSENEKAHFVIKFADRNVQINFIGNIIENGAPTANQLLNLQSSSDDKLIKCFNRLTKLNQEINRELRRLKRNKKIHLIRYRNYCFEYQENKNSTFISVRTEDQLKTVTKTFEYTETNNDAIRLTNLQESHNFGDN